MMDIKPIKLNGIERNWNISLFRKISMTNISHHNNILRDFLLDTQLLINGDTIISKEMVISKKERKLKSLAVI